MHPHSRWALGLVLLLLPAAANAEGPDAKPPMPDFDKLIVHIEPFPYGPNVVPETLIIESTGKCWYKVDASPSSVDVEHRRPGCTIDHQLGADRIKRLNERLAATKWLTAEGAESRATHTHPTTITLTLTRDGKTTSVVCHGQRPEPYAALLHELHGLSKQEQRIYLHDYVGDESGREAWREVGRELAALRGDPYVKPPFVIDYDRYIPIARRIVRGFYSESADELTAALRVVGHCKLKSELDYLHRMAHTRDSHVRREVAWALGRLHQPASLDVLADMMPAPDSRNTAGLALVSWGDDAVPHIVKLIAMSTDEKLDHRQRTTGEDMIRTYLEHWPTDPIDPRVIAAVRQALAAHNPSNGIVRVEYHRKFLERLATEKSE